MIRASPNRLELRKRLWYLLNNQSLTLVSMNRMEEAHQMAVDLKQLAIDLDDVGLVSWSSYTLCTVLHHRGMWEEAYREGLSENQGWHMAARSGNLGQLDENAFEFILFFAESARLSGHPEDALIAYEALCTVFTKTNRGALFSKLSEANLCEIADQLRAELGVSVTDSTENG